MLPARAWGAPRGGGTIASLLLTCKNKQVFFPRCAKAASGLAQCYRHSRPGHSAKNSLLPFSALVRLPPAPPARLMPRLGSRGGKGEQRAPRCSGERVLCRPARGPPPGSPAQGPPGGALPGVRGARSLPCCSGTHALPSQFPVLRIYFFLLPGLQDVIFSRRTAINIYKGQ